MASPRAYTTLATNTTTPLSVAFASTQPVAGDKIIVCFWLSGYSGSPSFTVTDNATSPNTYSSGISSVTASTQAVAVYYLDLPLSATWTGNYTISVASSAAPTEFDGGAAAYIGVNSGGPSPNTNSGTGSSNSASSGSISPTGTGLYVGGITDASGANPATLTAGGGFTNQVTQLNGATQQVGGFADITEGSGSKTASWTLEGTLAWNAVVAFWGDAPSIALPQPKPFPRISGLRVG